jgi:hypothetical protein
VILLEQAMVNEQVPDRLDVLNSFLTEFFARAFVSIAPLEVDFNDQERYIQTMLDDPHDVFDETFLSAVPGFDFANRTHISHLAVALQRALAREPFVQLLFMDKAWSSLEQGVHYFPQSVQQSIRVYCINHLTMTNLSSDVSKVLSSELTLYKAYVRLTYISGLRTKVVEEGATSKAGSERGKSVQTSLNLIEDFRTNSRSVVDAILKNGLYARGWVTNNFSPTFFV